MRNLLPHSKVELHVHLDGSVRAATVKQVARRRGTKLPTDDLEELVKLLSVSTDDPVDLGKLLEIFNTFMPVIAGDDEAVKQIAYEFCEDRAREGVVYTEARYCPHLLANTYPNPEFSEPGDLSPRRVVNLINEGLLEGSQRFGIKEAAKLGIHRTVHAGENGPAVNVDEAVGEMCAERVGHGYHVVDDEALYKRVLHNKVHIEVCPYSSIITGSANADKHPLKRFAEDGANFSLSTDDPLITRTSLADEYRFAIEKVGLNEGAIKQSNLNAAESSFLPEPEKRDLVEFLKKEYAV